MNDKIMMSVKENNNHFQSYIVRVHIPVLVYYTIMYANPYVRVCHGIGIIVKDKPVRI